MSDINRAKNNKIVAESYTDITSECLALLLDRFRKYGANNINLTGMEGIVVRLADKWSRLHSNLHTDFNDETVEDTLKDISNYAIIGLMLLKNKWPSE